MARRGNLKSITTPIILGAIAVPLSLALGVAWTLLLAQRISKGTEISGDVWLLVLGLIFFVVIMTVLVLFSIFLVREILEVRRQDSFIDSVTHELKSPLASIQLCIETLAREGVEPAQREQLRDMMLEDVERLTSFIDDVLQSSKLAHEGTGLNLSDVEVEGLIQGCAKRARQRHQLEEGAIEVRIDDVGVICTDRAALQIVVKNLIDNAVKYSSDEVAIRVHAATDAKGRIVIEVEDEGIGIPPKAIKRIFNRFYRVEHPDVRRRKGTGLGLFVVSALVRNLGGKVQAVSEGVGKGTLMRIVLPPSDRPDTPAAAPVYGEEAKER